MKHPLWLKAIIVLLVMTACLGLLLRLLANCELLGDFANFALILTLAAVTIYAYYMYRQTKEIIKQTEAIWQISASYELKQPPENPYVILFLIHNSSRYPLECWCRLKVTVLGRPSSLGGFYDSEWSFPVQSFQTGMGHFTVDQIVEKAGLTLNDVLDNWNKNRRKETLYLNIEFWYYPAGKEELKQEAPRYKFYFDFSRQKIVLDV